MAEQFNNEGSSSKLIVSGESSDSNVELNVKTLDSRIYHFVVDKNMPVSAFKEKIANEIGLAAGQQRLIFRGKVLKDEHRLSEYHVESGHTLHLVERQQPQSQQPADSGSGEPNSNSASQGTDANAPRSRVGQISHSVVLGTYNVGDQGEGGGALDISRVIGSVLNSIGLGNLTQPNGSVNIQTPVSLNVTGQGPLGNEAERARSNAAVQNQSGSQPSTGPSPPMPHVLQIPLGGAAIPLPSLLSPIPDSLQTLMDFMNRMEQFLARNGYQPNTTRTSSAQLPAITNARGLPTLEALTIVLRGAERLLSSQIIASLSHLAGSLERDGASHDISVRGQIHAEAAQLGITMQHLGALFLELGRTVLTLRMGQSPGESFVHSGPAVYISPSGPNPIMVQPFPHQTTSLFGTSVPPTNPIPFSTVGVGNPPRHLNIHIHAGGSVTPMAPGGWVNGGDGLHGERENANGSNDSTAARNLGNVFSGAMPPHSIGISASGAPQTSTVSGSQSNPLSSLVDQINSHIRRSLAGEVPEETQIPPGQTATSVANSSVGSTTSTSEQTGDQIEEPLLFSTESRASRHQSEHKPETEGINAPKVEDLKGSEASTDTLTGLPGSSSSSSEDALKAEAGPSTVESRDVPIGLGLGGLERKKRGKQPKIQTKGEETGMATTLPDKADASTTSGQILQSLLSRGSNVQPTGTGSSPSSGQQFTTFPSSGGQVPDVGGIMSQVLQSPMLNGLLSGVSEQTGAGSPDVLRNMLQQVTQNPAMMNVVGQIAQQINPQDLGGMFGGMGGQGSDGRGGGLDLSSMMQQMMPIVSQALGGGGGGSSRNQPFAGLVQDLQRQASDGFTNRDERGSSQIDQVGLQGVVRHIENLDPPQDVFRSMAENAAQQHANGTASHDILSALCSDEDLANEYAEILRRDLSKHHAHEE